YLSYCFNYNYYLKCKLIFWLAEYKMNLEIYDATLREGEQAGGVSFSIGDRIAIAEELDELGVDYIELGWPINEDVKKAFWEVEKLNLNSKVVAFGSTSLSGNVEEDINLKSIVDSKTKYACIFGKTWGEHIEKQLKISKEENLKKIEESVKFLKDKEIEVFYDAEHYFDGFKSDKEYAIETLKSALVGGATRLILCDTNGGSLPDEVKEITKFTKEELEKYFPDVDLGIHTHNDSGLALANTIEVLDYVKQVQGTMNGLGERVGNLDLCEFIPLVIFKKGYDLDVDLEKLKGVSDLVYEVANLPKQIGQAFVSDRAFTHKGGVHIDANIKGASYNHVTPERLGLNHSLMLSSLGGAACVVSAAKNLGYDLDKKDEKIREKINNVLKELGELEKEGYDLGNIEAEQYILIEKHFNKYENYFKILEWNIETSGKKSKCVLKIKVEDEVIETNNEIEGGPVDVLFKTLVEVLAKKYIEITKLKLINYSVRIAKSRGVESVVRTRMGFLDGAEFSCVGVDENIIQSSIEALEKGFNYYLNIKNRERNLNENSEI
ncbi:MAG: hypothetical protein KKF56_00780, partial [Nanoarchaeota archaeon]|nr:hypothetical protein [Nanoarchaeota archaeon]